MEQLAARLAERESQPLLDKGAWESARQNIRQAKTVDEKQTALDEAAEEVELAFAAGDEAVEYEEDEMAIAADDGGLAGPTPAEQRTIQYLTEYLPEILRHWNSEIWVAIDSDGAFSDHTYDEHIAAGYGDRNGPHKIPFFIEPSALIEPDVQKLIEWMSNELGLRGPVAERICLNLGWDW